MKAPVVAIAAGLVIGAAAWIDPLFIPLVLLGPLVTGAVCGWRRIEWRWVALAWATAGIDMVVSDWAINHEDVAFHVVVTVATVSLSAVGWLLGRRLRPQRTVPAGVG